jgi:DNA polymerase-3 subunit delta'
MKPVPLGKKTKHAASTLFLVPARSDRTTEGRRLAALLVGETQRDHALARRGAHPDVIELAPPEGKERVGIGQVRDAIRDGQFAPVQGDRKVCLIPTAEGLTPEAANALLKTLEEPPREMAFVLLAGHTTDLLPTIVSRSRIVRLPPTEQRDLLGRLRERGYDEHDARWLVSVADREGEIDRFLGSVVDVRALREAAAAQAAALEAPDLVATSVGGESILRREALSVLLERATRRETGLLTEGVRALAAQTRETLFAFLQDLLTVCFDHVLVLERNRTEPSADTLLRRTGIDGLRSTCIAIDHAHRALSVHGPTEAILLSLFLSIGDDADGR